jgi:hypothetical protein
MKKQCSTCKFYKSLNSYKGECKNSIVKYELPYQYNELFYNFGCRHWMNKVLR